MNLFFLFNCFRVRFAFYCFLALAQISMQSCKASKTSSVKAPRFLIADGKAFTQIVISNNPTRSANLAAKELKDHLFSLTGVELQITSVQDNEIPHTIYVGYSKYIEEAGFDDFEEGGYLIQSFEQSLILIGDDWDYKPPKLYSHGRVSVSNSEKNWQNSHGNMWRYPYNSLFKNYNKELNIWSFDRKGSLNAVYAYLRKLGFEWYMPGDLGEIKPAIDALPISIFRQEGKPDFDFRKIGFYGNAFFQAQREELLWQLRLTQSSSYSLLGDQAIGHGMAYVYGHPGMHEKNPEYYGVFDGRRDFSSRSQGKPCLSIQGLIDENISYAQRVFDDFEVPTISVMPGDGYYDICGCDLCNGKETTERGSNGKLSDYVWRYVNSVANGLRESHDDKKITCFAYSTYLLPPENIEKLSPNIIVGICQNRSSFHDPEVRERYMDIRRQWLKKTDNKIMIWDYYLHGRPSSNFDGVPVVFPRLIKEDLVSLKDISYGEFIEVYREFRPAPERKNLDLAFNHLNVYVTARLLWDVGLDLDDLLDDYFMNFYGPAKDHIREAFALAEEHWPNLHDKRSTIRKIFKLLEEGLSLCDENSKYRERIDLLLKYIHPLKELLATKRSMRSTTTKLRFIHGRDADIVIDGTLDDRFWAPHHAYKIHPRNVKDKNATTIKVVHSPSAIYMGITCMEENLQGMNVRPKVLDGESIEILLETQTHSFYQFALNPQGRLFEADLGNQGSNKWSSDILYSVSSDHMGWYAEIKIPVPRLEKKEQKIKGRQPSDRFPWHFNFFRHRVNNGKRTFFSFAPVKRENRYNSQTFAKLYRR